MNIQILPFQNEYIDDIWEIEQKSHAHCWQMMSIFAWQSPMQCNQVLLVDGHVVGYYYAQNVVGEISLLNIAIEPSSQGKGLGRRLLNGLIDAAQQQQASTIFLEVRESNVAAIHLYRKVGFIEQGRRKDYYPTETGREAAVIMSYDLSTTETSVYS